MKLFVSLLVLLFSIPGKGQDIPLTAAEKASLDSLLATDEFYMLMKQAQSPSSYVQLSAGIGNSYFSVKNRQLNATQLKNKLVFTASAGWSHKTGLSLSGSGYLLGNNGRTDFFQYSITPAYTYSRGKKVEAAVSYSHYFHRKGFENVASPIQNDFYVNINLKKPWVQPGIAIGYASGKFTEYHKIDTVLNGIRRIFIDTAKTSLSDFSITGYIQHRFEIYKVFNKKDGLSIVPQVLLNAGINSFKVSHQNPFITRLQNRYPNRFKNAGSYSDQSSLVIQSAAFNLGMTYGVGHIGIQPQVYLDYFIPESTDKKFTAIYSVVLSYIFD